MPTRRTIIANLAATLALVTMSLAIPLSDELLHQLVVRLPVAAAATPLTAR